MILTHLRPWNRSRSSNLVWISRQQASSWSCKVPNSLLNTFCTAEWGPCSWRRCSRASRTRASFRKLYFCCLEKHCQTETGFKINCLPTKGDNSITSYCIVLTFILAEIWWLVKEILVFWSIGYILFMDYDSKHKVDDLDDGWVLDSE